jgi:ADP-heptose:LPS heptosyltransferase
MIFGIMLKGSQMSPKTIAYFKSGIGNFVQFTPALQAMANMDATGKVDLCIDSTWGDYRKKAMFSIWENLPFINKVISIKDIVEEQYKVWFWTNWTNGGDARELFKGKHPYEPPEWDQEKESESDYYIRLAKMFYGYKGPKPSQMIVPAAQPIIDKQGKKLVVLCNGGFAELKVFKNWPGFSLFSSELKSYFPDMIIAKIGCGHELENVEADLDFVSKSTLAETAKVISQADLMVTTDTGNMHIADALRIPLIALWGGSSVAKNKPYETLCKIVHLGLPCQPCQANGDYRACQDFKCINDIQVGEVIYFVRSFFNKGDFNGNS